MIIQLVSVTTAVHMTGAASAKTWDQPQHSLASKGADTNPHSRMLGTVENRAHSFPTRQSILHSYQDLHHDCDPAAPVTAFETLDNSTPTQVPTQFNFYRILPLLTESTKERGSVLRGKKGPAR
jgi:hypothetical protein